jgi:hypothetical protein
MTGTDVEILLWVPFMVVVCACCLGAWIFGLAVIYRVRDELHVRRVRRARIDAYERAAAERRASRTARPHASGVHVDGRQIA